MKNKGKCGGSKSGESTKYKSKAAVNAKKTQKAGQKTASKAKSESRARGGAETFPGKDQLLPYCMSMNPRDYMRYGAAGHPNYPMIKNSDQLMEGLCRELTGDQKFYDESTVEQELEETSTVSSDALHLDLRGFQNLKIL
ncbi:hypothetical protein L596_011019 [Steinernema carpocapsae]|uniref:Uncharacterized protein n=1 Tax=Steinernema carpocapsae TaxID=34508 RepID=A0A4U5NTE6_STECR|nr:hypothetical protein L596_011019 [Steinernema carpocapsae]